MSTAYEEDDVTQNESAEPVTTTEEEPKKDSGKVDKEKVETAIQARLNQANRKHAAKEAELKAQIEELKRGSAMAPSPAPSGQTPQFTDEQIAQAHAALKQEAVAEYEHNKKVKDFQETIKTAVEEDKEFAQLLKQPKTGGLPDDVIAKTMHLKNAPAVLKHLFSNEKDYMEMVYASSPLEQVKLINSISDKLENKSSQPGPSKFTAQPDLSGMGGSSHNDDLDDYINDKYYQGLK